jgi:signal transduction histidine kinase
MENGNDTEGHCFWSDQEDQYLELAQLAALSCQMEIAAFTQVVDQRLHLLSAGGRLPSQISLSESFCKHVIDSGEGMSASWEGQGDAPHWQILFKDNPDLRFYAATPLRDHLGRTMGTFFLLDSKPQKLTEERGRLLDLFARYAMLLQKKGVLEDSLEQAEGKIQKLSSLVTLGEAAGGIAHEINNMSAIIQGKAVFLLRATQKGLLTEEKLVDGLKMIEKTTHRVTRVVRAIRLLSRFEELEPFQEVSFNSILGDAVELCRSRFDHQKILLRVEDFQEVNLLCSPELVMQAVINLLNNAHDAVAGEPSPEVVLKVHVTEKGITLSVIDNGPGFSEDLAQRLTEPFFTTKSNDKGTGLGLSIINRVVKAHGGKLEMRSHPKKTVFSIFFPLPEVLRESG